MRLKWNWTCLRWLRGLHVLAQKIFNMFLTSSMGQAPIFENPSHFMVFLFVTNSECNILVPLTRNMSTSIWFTNTIESFLIGSCASLICWYAFGGAPGSSCHPLHPLLVPNISSASCKVLFACEDAPPHVNGYLVLSRHVERLLRSHYDQPLHFFIVNVTCKKCTNLKLLYLKKYWMSVMCDINKTKLWYLLYTGIHWWWCNDDDGLAHT